MDPTLDPNAVNDQFYQENPTPNTSVPAPIVAPAANPGGLSLLTEDDKSFTVHGPNGMAVVPKNFDDPETGAAHQELYNRAKGATEADSMKSEDEMRAQAQPAAAPAPAPVVLPANTSTTAPEPAKGGIGTVSADQNSTNGQVKAPATGTPNNLPPGVSLVNLTETTRNQYNPDELKKLKEFQQSEIDAKKKEIDATNALNTLVQTKADRQSMENAKFIDEEMQRRHQEDIEKGERLAKYNAAKDQYAGLRVDSRRFWNDASTGDKLMATVAMAMAGMGNALQGRAGNPAWDIIDRNIDRDIDEQKTNIAQKGRELESERTAYQDFLKATGDERAARLATKELAMQKIADEFQSKIGAATNEVQKASLQAGLVGAQEKQAQYQMELGKVLVQTKPQVVTKGAPEPVNDTELAKLATDEANLDRLGEIHDMMKSNDTGAAKDLRARIAHAVGLSVDAPDEKLRAAVSTARNETINALFGGAQSEGEVARGRDSILDYFDNPVTAAAKLDTMMENKAREIAYRRKTFEGAGKRVGPTQSKFLQTYQQKFKKDYTTK